MIDPDDARSPVLIARLLVLLALVPLLLLGNAAPASAHSYYCGHGVDRHPWSGYDAVYVRSFYDGRHKHVVKIDYSWWNGRTDGYVTNAC